jgi:hypothetical protein
MKPADRKHAWKLVAIALLGVAWLAIAAWLGYGHG